MKKFALFAVVFSFLGVLAWGQGTTYTFAGGGDNNWTTPARWTPAPPPGSYPGDPTRQGSENDSVILNGTFSWAAAGTNLNVPQGTVIKDLIINGTAGIVINNLTVTGNLTHNSNQIMLRGNSSLTVHGTTEIRGAFEVCENSVLNITSNYIIKDGGYGNYPGIAYRTNTPDQVKIDGQVFYDDPWLADDDTSYDKGFPQIYIIKDNAKPVRFINADYRNVLIIIEPSANGVFIGPISTTGTVRINVAVSTTAFFSSINAGELIINDTLSNDLYITELTNFTPPVNIQVVNASSIGTGGNLVFNGDITTSAAGTTPFPVNGNQTYNGIGTVTFNGTRTLKATGSAAPNTGEITSNVTFNANNGININASNDITIGTGGIDTTPTTTGIVRLSSVNGNITATGSINAFRLIAKTKGDVSLGAVTINASNTGLHYEDAAIYVDADSFNATGGNNSINPGGGELCLLLPASWTNNNAVLNNAYHWHPAPVPVSSHIVYSSDPFSGSFTDGAGNNITPSNYINIVSGSNEDFIISAEANFNIYLIDVIENRSLEFNTSGTGYIEIRGNYTGTSLTLNSNNIYLNNNANVTLNLSAASVFNTSYSNLHLSGTGNTYKIQASSISLGTVTGGANKIELLGNSISTGAGSINVQNGFTVNSTGDINIGSGGVTTALTASGIIDLNAGQNIQINGPITGYQLLAKAVNEVVFAPFIDFNINSNGDGHGSAAAIYVRASVFSAIGSTGRLFPAANTTGILCRCEVAEDQQFISLSRITESQLCDPSSHTDKHLVFYRGPLPTEFNNTNVYNLIDIDSGASILNVYEVEYNKNIYIINAGNLGSESISFKVKDDYPPAGFIEIRGSYTSTGSLSFDPGSDGIRLNNAVINTQNFTANSTNTVTLTGNNQITAAAITIDGVINGNGNPFTLNGSVELNGGGNNLGALTINNAANNVVFGANVNAASVTVTGSGNTTISGNITTSGGTQSYGGSLTLAPAGGVARVLTGSSVFIQGAITGNNNSLTINGSASLNGVISANSINTLTINSGSYINSAPTVIIADTVVFNDVRLSLNTSGYNNFNNVTFENNVTVNTPINIGGNFNVASGIRTAASTGTIALWEGTVAEVTVQDVTITGFIKTTTASQIIAGAKNVSITTDASEPSIDIDVNQIDTNGNIDLIISGNTTLTVSNSTATKRFNDVTINGTVQFADNSDLAVNRLILNNGSVVRSVTTGSSANRWNLLEGSIIEPVTTGILPDISDCNSTDSQGLDLSQASDGGNNINVFTLLDTQKHLVLYRGNEAAVRAANPDLDDNDEYWWIEATNTISVLSFTIIPNKNVYLLGINDTVTAAQTPAVGITLQNVSVSYPEIRGTFIVNNGITVSGGGSTVTYQLKEGNLALENDTVFDSYVRAVGSGNKISKSNGNLTFEAASKIEGNGDLEIEASNTATIYFNTGALVSIGGKLELSANTTALNTNIKADGGIEFTGDVTVTGTIELETDDNDITFNDSILGTGSLELTAGAGDIEFAKMGVDTTNHPADITVISANDVAFNDTVFTGNINITNAGILYFKNAVTNTPTITVNSTGGVQMHDAGLVITGNSFNIGNDISFHETSNSITAQSISTTGGINISATKLELTATTSPGGSISINGGVTGTGDLVLDAPGAITFSDTVGVSGIPVNSINVINGNVTLSTALYVNAYTQEDGTVLFSAVNQSDIGSIEVIAPTVATIGVDIETTGAAGQSYGDVTLDGGPVVTRKLTGSNVALGYITGGNNSLTVEGNASLEGGTSIAALSIINGSYINSDPSNTIADTVIFNGASLTYNSAGINNFINVTFVNTVTVNTPIAVNGDLNAENGIISSASTGTIAFWDGTVTEVTANGVEILNMEVTTSLLKASGKDVLITTNKPDVEIDLDFIEADEINLVLNGTTAFVAQNNTSINRFTSVTVSGEVSFKDGDTLYTNELILNSGAVLQSASPGSKWYLNVPETEVTINATVPNLPVFIDCQSENYLGLVRNTQAYDDPYALGSGNVYVFLDVFTWMGTHNTDWNTSFNWSIDGGINTVTFVPPDNNRKTVIIIPDETVYQPNELKFNKDIILGTISIDADGAIDIDRFNLTAETSITNNGIIRAQGSSSQSVTVGGSPVTGTTVGGTIHYYNAGLTTTYWALRDSYVNIVIDTSLSMDSSLLSLTVTGNANIGSDIETTGNQTYGLQAAPGNVILTDSRKLKSSGTITFNSPVTGNNSFEAEAVNIIIRQNISTSGNQEYTGAVQIASSLVQLDAGTGNTVTFNNTVDANTAGAASLTINNSNVLFFDNVGNTVALNSLNVGAPATSGTTTINGTAPITIKTTGAQNYYGPVTLGSDVTFSGNAPVIANVIFYNTVNGTYSLTSASADLAFNGIVGGTAALTSIDATGGTVTVNAAASASLDSITTTGEQKYGIINFGNEDYELTSSNDSIVITGNIGHVSGTGNITLNAIDSTDGFVDINGTNLTINTGDLTINSTVVSITGLNTLTASGDVEINSSAVTISGNLITADSFVQDGGGASPDTVNLAVNITSTEDTGNALILFTGELTLTGNVTFTIPSVLTSTPASAGTINVTSIKNDAAPRILTLTGGTAAAPVNLEHTAGTPPVEIESNVAVLANSFVKLNTGVSVRQADTAALSIGNGSVLDISEGTWHIGTTGSSDFSGVNGSLTFGTNSKIIFNQTLALTGSSFSVAVTVTNPVTDRAFFSAIGSSVNVNIDNGIVSNFPYLVLEMAGSADQLLTLSSPLGDLHTGSLHVRQNTTLTHTASELKVYGEVIIKDSGVLNVGSNDITIYAGLEGRRNTTNWTNPGTGTAVSIGVWHIENVAALAPNTSTMTGFVFTQDSDKRVELKKNPYDSSSRPVYFEIRGNTLWQIFKVDEAGAVIQFSVYPDHHVFIEKFDINGSSDNPVILTRYVPSPSATGSSWIYIYPDNGPIQGTAAQGIPVYPPPTNLKNDSAERVKFWNFNLISSNTNSIILEHVRIYFSHAWYKRIPTIEFLYLDVEPFYYDGSPRRGRFNYDWTSIRNRIMYSFAEDSDGNGRLDRIRVQTNAEPVPHLDSFELFKIEVRDADGRIINLNTSKGNKGFDFVFDNTLNSDDHDSFYIYLMEGSELYDGRPVTWRITQNDSLVDWKFLYKIGMPNESFRTINTIPPRISHTLAIPGHNEIFVKFSQPVTVYSEAQEILIKDTSLGTITERIIASAPRPAFSLEFISYYNVVQRYNINNSYPFRPLAANGATVYILTVSNPPTVSQLAGLAPIGDSPSTWFFLDNLRNLAVRALDWRDILIDPSDYENYKPPRYPLNWNYKEYMAYEGNSHALKPDNTPLTDDDPANPVRDVDIFLPPYRVLTPAMVKELASGGSVTPADFISGPLSSPERRVTDILISREPANAADTNYFAWPVYAKVTDDPNLINYPDLNSEFRQGQPTDTNVIWEFDGTKRIDLLDANKNPRTEFELQTRVQTGLASSPGLIYANGLNVGIEFRVPKEMPQEYSSRNGGLWLPVSLHNLTHAVPYFYNALSSPLGSAPPLSTLKVDISSMINGGQFEFYYNFPGSDMVAARLAAPRGTVPSNWYELVRPFQFGISDLVKQMGGVTILNNVINSDKREITYLRYRLVKPGRVTVQVYTMDGTLVKSIRRNENRPAGDYTDYWDGTNQGGRPVARGMYFIRITAPDIDEIRKVMVVR